VCYQIYSIYNVRSQLQCQLVLLSTRRTAIWWWVRPVLAVSCWYRLVLQISKKNNHTNRCANTDARCLALRSCGYVIRYVTQSTKDYFFRSELPGQVDRHSELTYVSLCHCLKFLRCIMRQATYSLYALCPVIIKGAHDKSWTILNTQLCCDVNMLRRSRRHKFCILIK